MFATISRHRLANSATRLQVRRGIVPVNRTHQPSRRFQTVQATSSEPPQYHQRQDHHHGPPTKSPQAADVDLHEFRTIYDLTAKQTAQSVISFVKSLNAPGEVVKRLEDSIEANIMSSRQHWAFAIPQITLKLLDTSQVHVSPDLLRQLSILGFLVNFHIQHCLMTDDIIDRSPTRRGRPAWWTRPEIGLSAINDAFIIHHAVYHLFRQEFSSHPSYLSMLHIFQEASFLTEIGQSADMLLSIPPLLSPNPSCAGGDRLSRATKENYKWTVDHKTGAFFSIGLQMPLAFSQLATPLNLSQTKKLGLRCGYFIQVQNDWFDVFGDPDIQGKIGTDIREGKLSWVLVEALRRCEVSGDTERRRVLEDCYGVDDDVRVENVTRVYKELGMEEVYGEYEISAVGEIRGLLDGLDLSGGLRKDIIDLVPLKDMGMGRGRCVLSQIEAEIADRLRR